MLENYHYIDDMAYTVQVNRMILRSIGLWPVRTDSRLANILRAALVVICFSLLVFILTPYILYTFLKLESFKARLKMIGALFFYLMTLVMYVSLITREDQIRRCVTHVEEDWKKIRTAEDRKTMLKNVTNGRYITISAAIFLYTSCFTYRIILPLSRGRIVINENITIRPLVHSNYFIFFDPQITPAYEIVFSIQCLSSAVVYSTAIGVCGLSAMFVMHACGQLEVLMTWINNLMEDRQADKHTNIDRKLALIVDHHIRVRSFINRVEETLRDVYLVEVVGCTFIICLLGYYMITVGENIMLSKKHSQKHELRLSWLPLLFFTQYKIEYEKNDRVAVLTYTLLLTSFTVNIFVLCYIGEMLSEQGRKVNASSCTTSWYRLPYQKARSVILIIAMSNYPVKITAGKLFDLSFMSFSAVIRTSMAYLNLLRTMTV